jgi:hypothetical protein
LVFYESPFSDVDCQTLRSADFLLPALISGISYGSMSGLMAATPLAMLAEGIDADAAVVAVQCHILGMFVPSLFSGHLVRGSPHYLTPPPFRSSLSCVTCLTQSNVHCKSDQIEKTQISNTC